MWGPMVSKWLLRGKETRMAIGKEKEAENKGRERGREGGRLEYTVLAMTKAAVCLLYVQALL